MHINKDTELQELSSVLLNAYSLSQNGEDVRLSFLKNIRSIIPYTQSSFWTGSKNGLSSPVYVNMSERFLSKYKAYKSKDYVSCILSQEASCVYRDSDILKGNIRKNTDFFKNYLCPEDIEFGCGIVFYCNGQLLGLLNLFRSKEYGDFSKKELAILNFFKPHLELILTNSHLQSPDYRFNTLVKSAHKRYSLSSRECDVLLLMIKGFSTSDISTQLSISISTTKKHLNHIFEKMNVSHKNQIISKLLSTT